MPLFWPSFLSGIYTPLTERPSHEQVALEVETMLEFRSRLIASTQMAGKKEQDSTADMFVRAMVGQTEKMADHRISIAWFLRRFREVLRLGRADRGLRRVGVNKYQLNGRLLNRAFLGDKPVPRFTHIGSINVYRIAESVGIHRSHRPR